MRGRAFVPLLLFLAACAAREVDGTSVSIAHPGSWAPAADVVAYGNSITMPYDGAGPWDGGAHCGGGLLAGTMVLGDYLLANFPAIDTYGGYSCRQNTADLSQMSVHGTGRALDLMISMDATDADNDAGDPVAAWLILHAPEVGVQFLIWDHEDWGGARSVPKFRAYGGPVPHTDHIHMELTIAAAAMDAPWFTDGGPTRPADGGVVAPDAGTVTPDAGTTVTPDSGSASPDAGSIAPDAGAANDGGSTVTDDAGSGWDDLGYTPIDPTMDRRLRGGCACGVPPGAHAPSMQVAWLVVPALVFLRRRRRTTRR